MSQGKPAVDELKRLLNEVVEKIGTLDLPVGDDALKTFCRLTDHDYDWYRENNILPQGHIMTITVPMFQQFFITLGAMMIPSIIRGVIHTSSVVEYYTDMPFDRKYSGRMYIKELAQKTGDKGEYFVVDIDFQVSDDSGKKVASDIHQFFLKT